MKRVPSIIWALLLLADSYLGLEYGVAPLTGVLTGTAAPLPSSLMGMYLAMVALAIVLYYSVHEDRWRGFLGPVFRFISGAGPSTVVGRTARRITFTLVPIMAGWHGYSRITEQPEPPADPPGIHFNLPNRYVTVENPLPWTEKNIREGGVLYTKNCAMCHGDAQEGNGVFARAWQPRPANFRDSGTIAQLDENYLFWRIKEGGPGLPHGSIKYRSSMPVWDGILTVKQIWMIIMFEYTNAGVRPAKRK